MRKKAKLVLVLSLVALMSSFVFTGCSNNDNDTSNKTTAKSDESGNNDDNNVADDIGNAVDDVGDAVGDAVDGFSNYGDAHDYFMNTMSGANGNAQYELRNESEDLVDYNNGSKGYRFELYDTSSGSDQKSGEYYVDSKTGKIYMMDETSNTVTEYNGNGNSNNGTTGNNTGNNNNNNSDTEENTNKNAR